MTTYVVYEDEDGKPHFKEWTDKERPLMRCGCVAQATMTNFPAGDLPSETGYVDLLCCVIHDGPDGKFIINKKPSLDGRKAKCSYKHGRDGKEHDPPFVDSEWSLAFFQYKPDKEYDEYYCGCWGWD